MANTCASSCAKTIPQLKAWLGARHHRGAGGDSLLEQVEEIEGANVVRVAGPGAAEGLDAASFLAEAEQRRGERLQAGGVLGIGGNAGGGDLAGVVVSPV